MTTGKLEEEEERQRLVAEIKELEQKNRSLEGQLSNLSPEVLAELKEKNKELKASLIQVQRELAVELGNRKNPLDVNAISDKLQVLKADVLAFCKDREIDPGLWKKLESL